MKIFVDRKSMLAAILTWVVVLASFSDGANLTDLISGVTTLHFDECDIPSYADTGGGVGIPANARSKNDYARPSVAIRHVILDQDSPSLAAGPLPAGEALALLPIEEPLPVRHVYLSELLYLRHCTLLL